MTDNNKEPWIGVDLDCTLAKFDGWTSATDIGEPIPLMVNRVKEWRKNGVNVKIFTARIDLPDEDLLVQTVYAIQSWCKKHIGEVLPITDRKDDAMIMIWDDRCMQVIPNTGRTIAEQIDYIANTYTPDWSYEQLKDYVVVDRKHYEDELPEV